MEEFLDGCRPFDRVKQGWAARMFESFRFARLAFRV
jgi:hypothetical protein